MKINHKLLIIFISVLLIFTILISSTCYVYSKNTIKEQIYNHLETTAHSKENHINTFLREQERKLSLLAEEKHFIEFVKADENDEDYDELYKEANERINQINKGIGILSQEGVIMAAENNPVGTDYSKSPYFSAERNKTVFLTYYDKARDNTFLGIMTQIRDEETNEILATIGFDLEINELFEITQDTVGLGDTGETLLARRDLNGDAIFFTPRRFETEEDALPIIPQNRLDIPITQALLKNEALFEEEIDYHGEPVFAATRYIEETDWGLVTKIDKEEAFEPLKRLKNISILLSIIILIIGILVSFLVSKSITKPIKQLSECANYMKKGNLNKSCKVNSKDEIGELAETFEQMRKSLKSRNELLNSLLGSMKGKFGNIANIIFRKELQKVAEKDPEIMKILPKTFQKTIKKSKKFKESKDVSGVIDFFGKRGKKQ